MVTPFGIFDLIEAFSQPGCAICNLLTRDVNRFLDLLLYERVNQAGTPTMFKEARGLCNEHAWRLSEVLGGALGITILYRAVLEEVLSIVSQSSTQTANWPTLGRLLGADAGTGASTLADRLESVRPCPACTLLVESEAHYVQTLSQHIGDRRLEEAYRLSDGLCLPHFRQVLRQSSDSANHRLIIAVQTAIWTALRDQLKEFEEKHDYRRSGEGIGSEGDSWLRVIRHMAGLRGVFGLGRPGSKSK